MYPLFLLNAAPDPRVFGLDLQTVVQIVLILVNVAFLAFILSKLLYKPVLQILHDRRAGILASVQAAEKDKEEALKLKSQYEQLMKDIEQEKYDILDAARKQADEKGKEYIAEAKGEADAVKARALKEIELEQERAKNEMKQAVIDISSTMASKFLSKNLDEAAHEQLYNETIAELEEMAWHS